MFRIEILAMTMVDSKRNTLEIRKASIHVSCINNDRFTGA